MCVTKRNANRTKRNLNVKQRVLKKGFLNRKKEEQQEPKTLRTRNNVYNLKNESPNKRRIRIITKTGGSTDDNRMSKRRLPELDVFSRPPKRGIVNKSRYIEVETESVLTNNTQDEINFKLEKAGENEMIDLASLLLQLTSQIIYADGKPLANTGNGDSKVLANNKVALVNNGLHSIFTNCKVKLNGIHIANSNDLYAFCAYFADTFDTTLQAKKSLLTSQMYYKDAAEGFDQPNAVLNPAWSRRAVLHGATKQTMIGHLHSGIFRQPRYLIPGVEVSIGLTLAKPVFFLQSNEKKAGSQTEPIGAEAYKLKISEAKILVRYVELEPHIAKAMKADLEKSKALYPIQSMKAKTITMKLDSKEYKVLNAFDGRLPETLILAMFQDKAVSGNITMSPFNAGTHHLEKMTVKVDNEPIKNIVLSPDFKTNDYARTYMNLFQQMGFTPTEAQNLDISLSDFVGGYAFFPFNLCPGDAKFPGVYNKEGRVSIHLEFSEIPSYTIQLFVLGVFDNTIEIAANGSVTKEFDL